MEPLQGWRREMGLFHPKKGMKGQKMVCKPGKMEMGSAQVLFRGG